MNHQGTWLSNMVSAFRVGFQVIDYQAIYSAIVNDSGTQ